MNNLTHLKSVKAVLDSSRLSMRKLVLEAPTESSLVVSSMLLYRLDENIAFVKKAIIACYSEAHDRALFVEESPES